MVRNTKTVGARHPASSVQVEGCLEARHIDYRFEPSFEIDGIVDSEGHQVRLIENRAPQEMVARYAEQMRNGALFPAVVVNEHGALIDGNTRRRAAAKVGRNTFPAYICRGLTQLQARSLSVELNQSNGLPMSDPEVHAYIRSAVHEGQTLDTKACSRMTGVRPTTLERWKAQAQFELRAKRYGIPEAHVTALSESVQAALSGIRLRPALIDATALAVAARLSSSDVRQLVRRVNAAGSEAAALDAVAVEREARTEKIRSVASGFSPPSNPGHRSAMHIAALLKMEVDDLLNVPLEKRADAVARLHELRDRVDLALTMATNERVMDRRTDGSQFALAELSGHGAASG